MRGVKAVSYTHLDVYKRQTFSLLVFAQQYNIPAVSPRQVVEQQFSIAKISIDYGRPAVKGRVIFGDLVPFGEVWRAGANEATKITFGQEVLFGGQKAVSYTHLDVYKRQTISRATYFIF